MIMIDHHHHHHHRHDDISSSISIIIIEMMESSIEGGFLIYFPGRLVLFGCSSARPPWERYFVRSTNHSISVSAPLSMSDPVSYWFLSYRADTKLNEK